MKKRISAVAVSVAVLLVAAAGVEATPVLLNPGPGRSANPAALTAFQRAAATWSSYVGDPITVNIDADMQDMGNPVILGSTSSLFLVGPYGVVRDQMVLDASMDPDDGIVAFAPTATEFSASVPVGFGLNGNMAGTKANLKAMGFGGLDAAFGWSDASMTFNSGFSFDFDRSDGIAAGTYDFETVALHEIRHVLGFVSVVDTIDYSPSQSTPTRSYVYTLDVFRFGPLLPATAAEFTDYPRSLLPGYEAWFSDLDNLGSMSTGSYTGDGRQASHWKADELTGLYIGLMGPTLASATSEWITYADLRAIDVIGCDVEYTPVPEPASVLLLGAGLVGASRAWRRRRG